MDFFPTQISNWDGPEPDRWTRSNPPRGPSEGFSATRPSTPSDRGGGRPPLSGMYNGVGLQTPRGSGTTGHVQASKFLAKPRPSPSSSPSPSEAGGMRKPNKDIIEHDRKRQVELRLLVLIDALEEQGYTEAEIEARVDEARKAAEAEAAAEEVDEGRPPLQRKGFTDTQSHHAAEQKEKQLQTMRVAFGLDGENVHKKGEKKQRDI